jgi:hypothetical protein
LSVVLAFRLVSREKPRELVQARLVRHHCAQEIHGHGQDLDIPASTPGPAALHGQEVGRLAARDFPRLEAEPESELIALPGQLVRII